ncbi:FtsK/SpoIIIE domain-containing protein [Saccharothrix sp. BKS2]|uniref:FtsK/SpoIIIE domain-containing protein n=1 Tax=Saccharothrix sp. BKS2 TaxID=3064400 RepID=UPI0039EA7747
MSAPIRKDEDDMTGELIPFPGAAVPAPADEPGPVTPAPAAGPVQPAPEVLTGELVDEVEYAAQRRRRFTESLPALLGDPAARRQAGRDLGARVARVPLDYPAAVARGTVVTWRTWRAWVRVAELRDAAKEAGAATVVARFDDVRELSRARWRVTGIGVGVAGIGGTVVELAVGSVPLMIAGGVASAVLAVAGRRKDGTPGRKSVFPGPRTLAWTIDGAAFVEAFRAAKVIGPREVLLFAERPVNDGTGWAAVVDLPAGRKASSAIAAREALASALGVDESQVVLERVRGKGGHAARLRMWVADTDPLAEPPLVSYLEALPELSIWDGITIGATARGREVVVALTWTAWLIGGLPRYGKSNLLRLFLVAACLDPHTRIYAVDLKDGADFNPLRPVAHRLLIASAEGEDTVPTLLRLLELLVEVENEVLDRYRRFKAMPEADVPEGKITRALATDPAAGMPWIVLAIDECQLTFEALGSDDKEVKSLRRVIVDKVSWLIRKGPAAGCTVMLATQRPSAESVPTRLRDNVGSRAALRLPTQAASDMVLGTGMHAAGVSATAFTARHRGAAWLVADDLSGVGADEGVVIRAAKLDLGPTRAAAEIGRERREALGLLTGDAAGRPLTGGVDPAVLAVLADADDDGPVDAELLPEVLAALADVLGDDERGTVPVAELAARLDWTPKRLGEELRAAGVPSAGKRRVEGHPNPVAVVDVGAIRAALGG